MANLNSLKKYVNYRFSSGGVIGEDFKSFSTKLRNYIKAICEENGFEMVSYNRGHYESSGFIKNPKTNQFAYWSISDVRFWQNEWFDHVLYRMTDSEKDYRGKQNMYCSLENLGQSISNMFERYVVYNINNKEFSRSKMMEVGRDIASLWGGECLDFEVDNDKQVVTFKCIEHGEFFITEQAFAEF